MGQKFPDITDSLKEFILKQKLFFVASAPMGRTGHVNISPKGYDTLRIISSTKLYYLDLTGSGVETVAHMKENGRITLMWISFEKMPQIVRVWGKGRAVEAGSEEYESLVDPKLKALPGARAAIVVDVLMTGNSCGYSVPFFEFTGERTLLVDRAYKRVENVSGTLAMIVRQGDEI
ncbi:signal transduction histidine kinase, nitrogen specific [Gonapodya prolifera JEL478]|uniref:Signal transduction histidine kinase, nitrogen specific n=1 Tax=Gonapodya prolifera (strain JEL478) TaxID=1344416 RepID=A0A139AKG7_GONPJ|nr:signal transduction histidine kinase, nitrogen specific [Gonapodya prolifera JEL478]|eukprot:KXS17267.1 signal transduction histidine kinase, nitrogen specific [Gonapodya prolifera JEL478]